MDKLKRRGRGEEAREEVGGQGKWRERWKASKSGRAVCSELRAFRQEGYDFAFLRAMRAQTSAKKLGMKASQTNTVRWRSAQTLTKEAW